VGVNCVRRTLERKSGAGVLVVFAGWGGLGGEKESGRQLGGKHSEPIASGGGCFAGIVGKLGGATAKKKT